MNNLMLLSQLHGRGKITHDKARAAGYDSVEKIRDTDPEALSETLELSLTAARRMVKEAARMTTTTEVARVEQEAPLEKMEALEEIPGVGEKIASRLRAAGFESPGELARHDVAEIAEQTGLYPRIVTKILTELSPYFAPLPGEEIREKVEAPTATDEGVTREEAAVLDQSLEEGTQESPQQRVDREEGTATKEKPETSAELVAETAVEPEARSPKSPSQPVSAELVTESPLEREEESAVEEVAGAEEPERAESMGEEGTREFTAEEPTPSRSALAVGPSAHAEAHSTPKGEILEAALEVPDFRQKLIQHLAKTVKKRLSLSRG